MKKKLKLLKQKIQEAKIELSKQNFAETAAIEWAGDVPQNKLQEGIKVRLNLCKQAFPSLVILLPNYFDNQGVSSIIYLFNGKKMQAYVPSKLYEFVSDDGILRNDKAIERLILKIDELVA